MKHEKSRKVGQKKHLKRIMKIALWISYLPNKLTPAPYRFVQTGLWQSYIAVKIGGQTKFHLRQFSTLVLVEKLDLFEETSHRHFVHNKLSKLLVRASKHSVINKANVQLVETVSIRAFAKVMVLIKGKGISKT